MSERRGVLADVSWFQVTVSVLAAVTAAWVASRLGVGGTLIGAALGSIVIPISTAFYGRTLDKGKTLIVQTASGTIIHKEVQEGEIAEAVEEAAEVDDSPVQRAEVVDTPPSRLRWKRIVITSIVVLVVSLAAISTYELVTGQTLDGSNGTTIGDTFGGSRGDPDPDPAPSEPTSTPTPGDSDTPVPAPSTSTPTPSSSTPTPTQSTPTPTPTESPETPE